ncbi:Nucleoside 2-deoxyribosyltransferase [Anaerotruncus sp. 2789STDY5834896]|uniref:Nucleoside 2-deoxyribosyltransferase n=1 Tax=uncultured Anaerotruncus sp. TaxID=905011 RepID=A0A1C6FV49_9FIRM|nr:Nucleoside 2-deoxyribosyltransferase [uncultured Anaerotruncus sp.]
MFIDKNGIVRRPVAYLAGPDMFWPDGMEIGAGYVEMSHRYGIDGIFPPDPAREDQYREYTPQDNSQEELEKKIFTHDMNQIYRSDMIIANLNDFRRGQEPDSGTAFECGAAWALGLRCYAFLTDIRPLVERFSAAKHRSAEGRWADENCYVIEDRGLPLNLYFGVPFTVVQGNMEDAMKRARADFDRELVAAGHPPFDPEQI